MKIKVQYDYCNICGYCNEEVMVLSKGWGIFKFKICQGCYAKLFRLFKRGK